MIRTSSRRVLGLLIALGVASAALTGGGAAQAAPRRLTPWTNAMILHFTVGTARTPYSIRFIGSGAHRMTTEELYGCTGRVAATSSIEVARGDRAWEYGRPKWSGVVYRTTVGAQYFEYVGQKIQTRVHYASRAALVHRVQDLLRTDREKVVRAVGGDRSESRRKDRARDDVLNLASEVDSELARATEVYERVAHRTDPAPPVDPRTLRLDDRSTLHDWDRANGLEWSWLTKRTWSVGLQKSWRRKAGCGEGLGDPRYHRVVTVSGTGAAWTATVEDVEDGFVVSIDSAGRLRTSSR